MNMNFSLNLEQSQKLVMTPELKQAIQILQYTSNELNAFIDDALLTNPVLDRQSNEYEVESTVYDQNKEKTETQEREIDWESVANYFDDSMPNYKVNYSSEEDEINYDNFVASEKTLHEHLLMQLGYVEEDYLFKCIAVYLIENIDKNGYLNVDEQYIYEKFQIDHLFFDKVLKTVQSFEPAGVGARDVKECLTLQLINMGYEDSYEMEIVDKYLSNLSDCKYQLIGKNMKISVDLVQDCCDFIRTLEPKPGRLFSSAYETRYISPDVTVKKIKGEYVIVVNESTAPKLFINKHYKRILSNQDSDKVAKDYVNDKLNAAMKIIKSIEQRKQTIYRVCETIVSYQVEFLEKGVLYLKPLNLKDIADEISVHESTVSRAIHGKYMQTPNGLFEIKFFFQSGVKGESGEGVAAGSVKSIIKDMIDKENPQKPISDQRIANQLSDMGVSISRRTVAKYRDELKIPSSSKRKRY